MVRLVALFTAVRDREAFLRAYTRDHLPLARTMPGLLGLRHGPARSVQGEDVSYVAELLFADRASLEASMRSPEGRQAGGTLATLPAGGVTLIMVEGSGVEP